MWTKNFKPPSLFSSTIVKSALSHFFPILFFSSLFFNGISYAATHPVNDESELASAINTANGNGQTDIIQINADITLSAALPQITSEITIGGNGHTIDASSNCVIFDIGSGADVTINQLVLKNGRGKGGLTRNGGAIYNLGKLTINQSSFVGNSGNGGNGGAIYNDGSSANLTVTNSTFYDNESSIGGGIHNDNNGTVDIKNCTFSQNNATTEGGGIRGESGTITIKNSIIAGNTANSNPEDLSKSSATFTSGSYNIIGNVGNVTGVFSSGTNDQVGVDPKLDAFDTTNNYYPLQSDSPALNAIPNGTNDCGGIVNQDQRGVTRPQGGNCDIGAYEFEYFSLTLNKDGDGNGTVGSDETDGIDCGSNCTKEYPKGTNVTLTQVADSYSTFASWSTGCTSPLTINSDTTCTATFDSEYFQLTLNKDGDGDGTVSSTGTDGISCGLDCMKYPKNTSVTLTQVADSYSTFASWSTGCTSPLTINSNTTCTATFNPKPFFTLQITTNGDGTVNSNGTATGNNCGPNCTEYRYYDSNTSVSLTPTPNSGSTFKEWQGEGCQETFTIDSHKKCTAVFETQPQDSGSSTGTIAYPLPRELTISVEVGGTGGGQVKSKPGGINCKSTDCTKVSHTVDSNGIQCEPAACQQRFKTGSYVYFTVTPDSDSEFSGWGGTTDCLDNKLWVTGHKYCVAYFKKKPVVEPPPEPSPAEPSPPEPSQPVAQLINLSTRAPIEGGARDIIAGFILRGTGQQKLLIRGFSLDKIDPLLTLQTYPQGEIIATNDNWQDDLQENDFPQAHLKPEQAIDAALLLELPVGAYTATLSSVNNQGLGLVSVDFIQEEGKTATAQLVNLSTRGMIRGGAGDIIAGFIIQGEGSQKVFLRGWGLESSVDPQLILQKYPSGDLVATNKNWQDDARANEIPSGMELPQITDAGLLLELPVGGYTVTLSSEGETGLGLVGIDWLD